MRGVILDTYNQKVIHDNAPTITTRVNASNEIYAVEGEKMSNLRIRKLIPLETVKLMGFERKDEQAMRQVGMSDSAIYHCCGDALITTLFAMLIATMLPMGEDVAKKKVEEYIKSLVEN